MTITKHGHTSKDYTYQTMYSTEDQEFVTTCDSFPSLSWLNKDADKSLTGMIALVDEVLVDMDQTGENPPVPSVYPFNYVSTPEKYGVVNKKPLVAPDRYYFLGRVMANERGEYPKGTSRSDADMFPRRFMYNGKLITDTKPYVMPEPFLSLIHI